MECIICKKSKLHKIPLINEISRYTKKAYPLYKCDNCGLIRPKPLPYNENNKNSIYNVAENIKFYDSETKKIRRDSYEYKYYSAYFQPYLDIIEEFKISGNALDIGCGAGHLLELLSKKGFDTAGIDISPVLVESLKSDGLNVSCCDVGDKRLNKNKYDLITLNQVLEHVVDPENFIKNLNRLLKEEGYLILAVPYLSGLVPQILRSRWYGLGYGQHLNFFSKKSLRLLFERKGFKIIEFRVLSVSYDHPSFPRILNMFANTLTRGIVSLGLGDNLFLIVKKLKNKVEK